MDTNPWVIPLDEAAPADDPQIGGKAAQLARLRRAGFRIAPGFCVTVAAYEQFLQETQIQRIIQMELGRKSFEEMRWEEIWDAALRIRNRFSLAEMPAAVVHAIRRAVQTLDNSSALAVRSSAPGEDSAQRSFAGLHESFLNVSGEEAILESVRLVWASLWSDAALLYRQELALDPLKSQMAVLIQEMRTEDRSGVSFGRDPRSEQNDHAVIEAVPGTCSGLVDGSVDPDHWLIHRVSHQVVAFRSGHREGSKEYEPLLQHHDLESLLALLDQVESRLGWCPDVEWTGRRDRLTVLQARPITKARQDPDDKRAWYLTLRPNQKRLQELCHRVTNELIPELRSIGNQLAAEQLEDFHDLELADCIEARQALLEKWKRIYWDEFIPFAHGVRYLGLYYNDAVHPQDPYEFVGLLKGEDMLASQRNHSLRELAQQVRESPALQQALDRMIQQTSASDAFDWDSWQSHLLIIPEGFRFFDSLKKLLDQYMDVAFDGKRLLNSPAALLRNILELASRSATSTSPMENHETVAANTLEKRLLNALDPVRHEEAREVLAACKDQLATPRRR